MNTPLMELIEKLNNHLLNKYGQFSTFELGLIKDIKKDATELLEKERQIIIDAYHINPNESVFGNVGSDYYTKTFTNESK